MKTILLSFVVVAFGSSPARAQDVMLKKLVETEKAFTAAAATTSVRQAFIEFCADDGVVFQQWPVNAREFWQSRPKSAALLAWTPAWADISANGDLGYTTGDWDFRPAGKDDTPVAFGQYITLWKKQADGEFKAVLDIGITHEKPDVVSDQWTSPHDTSAQPNIATEIARPSLEFLSVAQYETSLAPQARIYRETKMPFIGKQAALKQVTSEQADIASGQVTDAKYDGTDDLIYGYGVLELTRTDGSVENGNLMRIWKRHNDNWQIALEIFAPVAVQND